MHKLLLSAAVIAMTSMPVQAGPSDNSLIWASDSIPANIEFYEGGAIREGLVLGKHIWDTLMEYDAVSGTYQPHLAESYEFIDATTIEFKLRRGVLFHNGHELNADDVVATVEYVTTKITSLPIVFLSGAEKIDDYTVRLITPRQFPTILENLANQLPIYPAAYFQEVGSEGMSRAPIGTGPYKVVEHLEGESVTMELFPDYFGGVKGEPVLDRIVFRRIAEFNTQAIELMTGGVDWIWRVPPDAVQQLANSGTVKVERGATARFGFLRMDAAGISGENPLTDILVRKAINHAIDREGIRAAFMGEGSEVIDAPCSPMQFGCVLDHVVTYEFDPKKARALLAEAGYPNGFEITLYAYRDRAVVEAILGNLAAVGITANLQYLQASALTTVRDEKQLTMLYQVWGSQSVMDVSGAIGFWFDGSANDLSLDATVTDLLQQGITIDADVRLKVYAEALGLISEQAYVVPMFTYPVTYAFNPALNFVSTADELPKFYQVSWQ